MAQRWTESQIERWLAGGSKPGLATTESKIIDVDDPANPGELKGVRQITYYRNDGETITVIEAGTETTGAQSPGPDPGMPGGTNPGARTEKVYEVTSGPGKKPEEPARDSRSPEQRRDQEQEDAEKQRNLAETNLWETNAQRRAREQQEENRREAEEAKRRADEVARGNLDVNRGQLTIQQQAEARAQRGQDLTAEQQAEANRLARERFEEDKKKEAREANTPKFLGTPTDTSANIAYFDPASGEVKGAPNPMYDAVKVEAARKREELNLQIQLGRLQADQAAAEYNRWFKQNVEVPFMQAAERRAQAQEKRAALQAEEQRRQFAAQEARQRRSMGLQAGQAAVQAEVSLLPYRVGPKFGQQFGDAVTSLGRGGSMDTNASAGINFTQDAFEFDRPDFKSISNAAMKDALKGLTNYDPAEGEFATPDYSGINFPTGGGAAAPAAAPSGLPSYESIINNMPYTPQT
jgi:hypothetical protein